MLIKGLDDASVDVRANSARVLAKAGVGGQKAVNPLAARVKNDKAASVRAAAVEALGGIGVGGVPVIYALRQAVKDLEDEVKSAAGQSLSSRQIPAHNRSLP